MKFLCGIKHTIITQNHTLGNIISIHSRETLQEDNHPCTSRKYLCNYFMYPKQFEMLKWIKNTGGKWVSISREKQDRKSELEAVRLVLNINPSFRFKKWEISKLKKLKWMKLVQKVWIFRFQIPKARIHGRFENWKSAQKPIFEVDRGYLIKD